MDSLKFVALMLGDTEQLEELTTQLADVLRASSGTCSGRCRGWRDRVGAE